MKGLSVAPSTGSFLIAPEETLLETRPLPEEGCGFIEEAPGKI